MTDVEIVLKTQILGSAFSEYLAYFEPIYQANAAARAALINKRDKKGYARAQSFYKQELKEFKQLKAVADRFSTIMETNLPDKHDEGIELIHNALLEIKIEKDEKEK